MSPEELDGMRAMVGIKDPGRFGFAGKLLAHIDEQAKQIESWRQACFLRTQVVGQVERENHKLRDQIATLKAALITEKAMSLHWYQTAKEGETRDWEEYSGEEQESRLWYAEHRLARELPDIFGDDRI
ncbi:hypothetical protein M0R72_07140 [Candidatus Pacearchaeota archaeon]|jgi:IS1 family transposase|nr:hypothetical protein [Candidatus Pacearchaeota archaeon]